MNRMAPAPNERSGVEAGRALCLHMLWRWPGATHRGCYAPQTDFMNQKSPSISWQKQLLPMAVIILGALGIVEVCRALFGGGVCSSWVALGIAAVLAICACYGRRRQNDQPG